MAGLMRLTHSLLTNTVGGRCRHAACAWQLRSRFFLLSASPTKPRCHLRARCWSPATALAATRTGVSGPVRTCIRCQCSGAVALRARRATALTCAAAAAASAAAAAPRLRVMAAGTRLGAVHPPADAGHLDLRRRQAALRRPGREPLEAARLRGGACVKPPGVPLAYVCVCPFAASYFLLPERPIICPQHSAAVAVAAVTLQPCESLVIDPACAPAAAIRGAVRTAAGMQWSR